MELKLPVNSQVNKFIPKNKFFSKAVLSTKIKDDFTDWIQKITWRYKLSPETLWISKTSKIEEIQIFELELKDREIPLMAMKTIDKLIPYPILYILNHQNEFMYGIALKNENWRYYFSEWNENIEFDFHWINLEVVYENIVKRFIRQVDTNSGDFKEMVNNDKRINILNSEIQSLKNKIKTEKQFNKKVVLNNKLQEKQIELKSIK